MPKTLLDLPNELLPMIGGNLPAKELANLAGTCNRFHYLFKPELDKRAAKQLMAYVLNPTTENIAKAKAMVAANPRIMFIPTEGYEPASGIEEYIDETGQPRKRIKHRKVVNCSPIQAVCGTGDTQLYNDMATHFNKVVYRDDNGNAIETGIELAERQIKERFPNGFEYPPVEEDFKKLLSDIGTAISQDRTHNNQPSETTQTLLKEFRKKFLPKDVTQGHHFNLNYLIEAFNEYDRNCDPWNNNQRSLFFRQVIGYLERQVTVVQAQAICEGITNHLKQKEQKQPHGRSLDVYDYASNSYVSYYDSSAAGALGLDVGIALWQRPPGRRAGAARVLVGAPRSDAPFLEQTHQSLTTFCSELRSEFTPRRESNRIL